VEFYELRHNGVLESSDAGSCIDCLSELQEWRLRACTPHGSTRGPVLRKRAEADRSLSGKSRSRSLARCGCYNTKTLYSGKGHQGARKGWSSSPKQANDAPGSSAARPTSEDDTATTFELFFDLVYVFAMTQGHRLYGSRSRRVGGIPGPSCPRAAVVDLVCVRLAWQPNQGRYRRRACRHGRGDGGAVRGGPHDPGSLGRRRGGPLRTARTGRRLPIARAVRAPERVRAGSARRCRAAPAARDLMGSDCGRAILLVAGVLFLGGSCRLCSSPAPSSWTGAAST
jgi:hypothetical protein